MQSRGTARRPGGLATLLGLVLGLATLAALLVALLPGHGPAPRARAAPSSAVPAQGPSARAVAESAGDLAVVDADRPADPAATHGAPVVLAPGPPPSWSGATAAATGRPTGAPAGRSPPRTAGT